MKAINPVRAFNEGTLTRIPLRFLVEHPEIIYRELNTDWVKELSENIAQVGLTVPLIVWNGGGEKGAKMKVGEETVPASFLVAGNHRRAALKALMKTNASRFKELFPDGIPVMVIGGELSDVLTAQLRENVMREDMSPEQVFPVLEKLLAKEANGGCGMRQKDVAKAIGKSTGWVSQILTIKEELGDEGVTALKKKEVGLAEAREAAASVKKDKKAGKPTDAKAALNKVKEKAAARKAAGKVREAKRLSAKVLWKRFLALPKMNLGEAKAILESALGYLAGDDDVELSEELTSETEESEDSEE